MFKDNQFRRRELIAWLFHIIPEQYMPLPIVEMQKEAGCGSRDCAEEIITAYVQGENQYAGILFRYMPGYEIFDLAMRLKGEREDRTPVQADPKRTTLHDEVHEQMMRQIKQIQDDIADLKRH